MSAAGSTGRSPDAPSFARGHALSGFVLGALPLVALALPLLDHRSPSPAWGPYSRRYASGLLLAGALCLVVPALVAWRCSRAGSRRPAYAFLLATAGCLLALLVGEGLMGFLQATSLIPHPFAEYAKWGNRKAVLFGFEARPYTRWTGAGASYGTDGRGFRVNPGTQPSESEARTRIAALGESSTFGYGLNDDETWPELVERELCRRRGNSVLVTNAGNNGHNSLQTLLRYYLKVRYLRPTQVLFYAARNDTVSTLLPEDTVFLEEEALFSESLLEYQRASRTQQNVYSRTLLWLYLSHVLTGPSARPIRERGVRAPVDQVISVAAERFARHVVTLADLCRRDGVQLVLLTFLADVRGLQPLEAREIVVFNAVLRDIARAGGLPLIDLERRFAGQPFKESFFFGDDHYHPNRKGAAYIAAEVAPELDRLLGAYSAR